jgi:hypothetical protein
VTSRLSVGSRRGATHPRDMMFRTSDPWSSYKSKGTQPNESMALEQEIWRVILRQRTEAELPRWKTSSQEWDALGGFGEV